MRNACILLALLCWFLLIVGLALARQWAFMAPLLALGGLVEALTHGTTKE